MRFRTPFFYRLVRHPLYSGFILAFWATPVMTIGHLVLALGMTVYILIAIGYEERDLVDAFGDEYRTYRKATGMLIPGDRAQQGLTRGGATALHRGACPNAPHRPDSTKRKRPTPCAAGASAPDLARGRGGDPQRAEDAAGAARRLPHAGCARRRALCRQGARAEEPRDQLHPGRPACPSGCSGWSRRRGR